MNEPKIINLKTQSYQDICEEYSEILTIEKELAERKKHAKERLLKAAGGNRMEYGLKIQNIESKGSVDYKKVLDELCKDSLKIDYLCEKHRKDPIKKTLITKY